MNAIKFFDTNILVYAYDLDSAEKRKVALQLIESAWHTPQEAVISIQVLQETYVNLVRKGVVFREATEIIQEFLAWQVVENTTQLLLDGLREQDRWKVSFWDALILAAARQAGAAMLLTEDLNDGQDYDGVRVVNPFRS